MTSMEEFINKLINSTDKNTIKWFNITDSVNFILESYLKEHEDIDITATASTQKLNINVKDSYCMRYRAGYCFLFNEYPDDHPDRKYFILAVQGDVSSKIVEMNLFKENQADLFRLYNLIERQVNNVTSFIKQILDDDSI